MLPDWMGGGSPTKEKAPKRGGSVGSAAGVGASAVPSKIPDWAKSDSSSSSGSTSNPVLDALKAGPQLNQGPVFDPLKALQDELGMKAGALTPAAELAKAEEPAGAWAKMFEVPKPEKGMEPRGTGRMKTRELTREDYLGLPADVRAAIDFNTMLVQARQADREQRRSGEGPKIQNKVNLGTVTMPNGMPMQATPTTTMQTLPDGYGDVYEAVFGQNPTRMTGLGMGPDAQPIESEKLAPVSPEVLSVLKQIGYKSDDPAEMRDFLTLQNGISQSDINNYLMDNDKPAVPSLIPGAGEPLKNDREVFVEKIASLTLELQDKLAKGDKLIADFQTSAKADREADRLFLGANVQKTELPEGFGDRKVDQMFQETFEYLLQQPNQAELQNQLANFNNFLGTQGLDPDSFLTFAQTRLENADLGAPLGTGIKVGTKNQPFEYRSPEEYRTLFGLTKEK